MDEPYIGAIVMFAGNFAPRGWAFCNGQILPISQNTALFSILGTTYGGNGTTTFALPDLRGRVAIHPGQGPGLSNYDLGQQGGSETVTLTQNQMPSHTHTVNASTNAPGRGGNSPTGNLLTVASDANNVTVNLYTGGAPNTTMSPQMVANAGGNQPVPDIQPYTCVNYIIALQGIFPSRN